MFKKIKKVRTLQGRALEKPGREKALNFSAGIRINPPPKKII